MERQQQVAQIPAATGLRWAAAFIVFGHHVSGFGYFGGQAAEVVGWAFGPGATGVSFFFVLSGFVLAYSARMSDSVLGFLRRRVARVLPLHLVTALTALALGSSLIPGLLPKTAGQGLANVFLVSSWRPDWWQTLNPVSWSLTCEAFFYLTFPFLLWALRRAGKVVLHGVAAASGAVVVLLPWLNEILHLGWQLHSHPLVRWPEFVLGVSLGLLVRYGWWRGPSTAAAVATTIVGYFLTSRLDGGFGFAACTVLGFALLIPAVATADIARAPSIWRTPTMVRLGELSFAFYLVHVLVMLVVREFTGTNPKLGFAAAFTLTSAVTLVSLALSWILCEYVEKPARRLLLPRVVRRPEKALAHA
jgi:peptidoglycan/LPS O-acetylase OafA/YrhL